MPTSRAFPRLRTLAATVIASASLLVLTAAPAHAGVLVKTATGCGTETLTQPFTRWQDSASYALVANGALESGAVDWTLSGASVVTGNEGYYVHAAQDSHSLYLPAGSSATTRAHCVGLSKPSMRFFARSANTGLLASLKVEVLVESSLGLTLSLPIGNVSPGAAWSPSPRFLIVANLLPLLPGQQTPVAFRFTPQGTGSWWIDDVYVDPHRSS
jgi:hypothetical protein